MGSDGWHDYFSLYNLPTAWLGITLLKKMLYMGALLPHIFLQTSISEDESGFIMAAFETTLRLSIYIREWFRKELMSSLREDMRPRGCYFGPTNLAQVLSKGNVASPSTFGMQCRDSVESTPKPLALKFMEICWLRGTRRYLYYPSRQTTNNNQIIVFCTGKLLPSLWQWRP